MLCPAGSFDRFLNLQIGFVICLQLCMCLFCAVASYIWRQHMGNDRYYLAFNSYVQVGIRILRSPFLAAAFVVQIWQETHVQGRCSKLLFS